MHLCHGLWLRTTVIKAQSDGIKFDVILLFVLYGAVLPNC